MSVLSRSKRTVLLAAAAVVATAVAGGTAVAATSSDDVASETALVEEAPVEDPDLAAKLSPEDAAKMEAQAPLLDAANTLRWEVETTTYTGYTGITLEDDYVALWWKGRLPASMAVSCLRQYVAARSFSDRPRAEASKAA